MQGDHSEKRYHILGRKHTDDAGKRSAVKVACCVWRGAFGTGQQCTSLDAYPTQIAVEYAYAHREAYRAVFWVLADSSESLVAGYMTMARLLELPVKDEQDQQIIVEAVKQWLTTQTRWLLILDNADDLAMVRDVLPTRHSGHLLLTTRAQAMGRLAWRIEVEMMEDDAGVVFVLRRTGLVTQNAGIESASLSDVTDAREIVKELGGLPLALDQAGAYIEETQCGLSGYLHLYRTQRKKLLMERGGLVDDHPASVTTTWSLSFEIVEQRNPAAADLLRFCASLAPDGIPEGILTTGAAHLGPLLQAVVTDPIAFNEAMRALGSYSLLKRDATRSMISVHRLVQAVLKERMDDEERQCWAERTVRVVAAALPPVEHRDWPAWERTLTHAFVCHHLIKERYIQGHEGVFLLQQTGRYLMERARYEEAESLLLQGHQMRERVYGMEHVETATSLNDLAGLYRVQGRYQEAEPLYTHALEICEQKLGATHLDTAHNLNDLALLSENQGKYEQAEQLYDRAVAIYEHYRGREHPDTATCLSNLANLYGCQGKYERAELLSERSLAIREKQLGAEHPDTASGLICLALLYKNQGKYEQAEPLYKRALAVSERQLGPEHPEIARCLNNLAALYDELGDHDQAEPLYTRALAMSERQLGPEHPDTMIYLSNLALLYDSQEKYTQAEVLLVQVLAMNEHCLGVGHPDTAMSMNNLASCYESQEKYTQVGSLYERALLIFEQVFGLGHPRTSVIRENYTIFLQKRDDPEEKMVL